MQPFNFHRAEDPHTASQNFALTDQYIAGGTTLLDLLKLHVENTSKVVDITPLDLKFVRDNGDHFEIGALVTNTDLANHKGIQDNLPVLSQAILSGASPQLRNLATTGGNLLQRTRCSYFRDTAMACNKRNPGSGCAAIKGFNRMHAILGGSSSCIASHPSDMCVALTALEAQIHTLHGADRRVINIDQFYRTPGATPHIENVLRPGELITSITIAKKPWFKKSHYVKIRDRASYAFALTSAAVAISMKDKNIEDIRIALGGVGTVPWRSKEAENVLREKALSEASITEAAKAALADANPTEHNRFKVILAQNTLTRALKEAGGLS